MSTSITWGDVVAVAGLLPIIIGGLWALWGMIQKVRDEVAALRLEVAREYVSTETMSKIENRLALAIDRIGERLEKWLERVPNDHNR